MLNENRIMNKNNCDFCSSAFALNNPFQRSLLNDNWYFAITLFPKIPYGLSLSSCVYKDLDHENELSNDRLTDIFYPFSDQKYDKIPIPIFSAHTFILIIELSCTTKPFLPILFSILKEYFSQKRPIFFTVLVIHGSSIIFPSIHKNSKNFSISTWSDFSEIFELQQESLYFNMSESKGTELFQKYLDSVEIMDVEPNFTAVDIFDILKSLFPFFKSLRNPIWIICSNLYIHQYPSTKKAEEVSQLYYQSSLNIDFYFLISNPDLTSNDNIIRNNPSLQLFSTKCNCPIKYFGVSQFERISIDLIYNFSKPRTIFNRVDIFTSNCLEVSKIYGRGSQIDSDVYKPSTLTVNDTIHIFVKPNTKKLQNEKPKIVVRTRYVDGATNCFLRYVPIDCSNRETYPEAVLTAAAIKIINENYDSNDAIKELLQLDLSITNIANWKNPLLLRKRYNFAVISLGLIKSDLMISNFVIGNCPKDVFEFLSPICCQIIRSNSSVKLNSNLVIQINDSNISLSEWTIVPEVVLGSGMFLIWVLEHQFIFIVNESNNDKLSDIEIDNIIASIDEKGKFEVVDFSNFYQNQYLVRIDSLSRHYLSCHL